MDLNPSVLLPPLNVLPLFHGLTPRELAELEPLLKRIDLPSGTLLLTRDQQQSDYLYILIVGAVKVQIEQADGSVAIVAVLGPHQVIGEMSQTDGFGCSATVETIDRSVVLRMAAADYHALARTMPALSHNLLRIFSARLRIANQQILALVTLDATQRIAAQIRALAQVYGSSENGPVHIPFRLTQSTLAAMTGLSRVRVNRVIQELVARGTIALTARYQIAVLDEVVLLACATPGLSQPTTDASTPFNARELVG